MTVTLLDPTKRPAPDDQQRKGFRVAHFKALSGSDAPGTFEAVVAVFDNIDSDGDRIRKGAFTRTLDERGLPPIVWSHIWDVPPIGTPLDAAEVDASEKGAGIPAGLWIKARLLVDVAGGEDHAVARQVWAAMTALGGDGQPPLKEFSFGYRTRKAQFVQEDVDTLPPELQWTGGEIRDLLDVDLWEVGPTLMGANSATRLIDAKAAVTAAVKSGALSADVASTLLDASSRKGGDNPAPNDAPPAAPEGDIGGPSEEVQVRIAAIEAEMRPPTAL